VVPEGAQAHRIGVVEAAGYAHKVSLKMYSSIWEAVVQPRKEPMSIKEVGGPVAVYEFTEQARKRSVDTGDWGFLIDWIAFFSINLGVINLLPIPVLDGGHISISVVEGIRRKKLAVKTRNVLNIIGAVLVLGIFVLAITSDVLRLTGNK
jgi:regulator of sigma E protease